MKKSLTRLEQINIRLSTEERAQIAAAATADSRTISDWMRWLALAESSSRKKKEAK